jgi:hypothetical protein
MKKTKRVINHEPSPTKPLTRAIHFMNRFLYSFLPSLHSNITVGLNHEQAQNTKTTSRTTHSLEFTTRTLLTYHFATLFVSLSLPLLFQIPIF